MCVTVKGISSLPADKLGQLLTLSGSSAGTLAAQRMPAGAAPAGGSPGSGSGVAAVQQGLASAWAVTDVVQVWSEANGCHFRCGCVPNTLDINPLLAVAWMAGWMDATNA